MAAAGHLTGSLKDNDKESPCLEYQQTHKKGGGFGNNTP